MVLKKYKKSNKRKLSRNKKQTNTKRQKRVQKGGLYPDDDIKKPDGTLYTREEYIDLLKAHIGLSDQNILAIEGNPNYSRDGIDHSREYNGTKLMAFKIKLSQDLTSILNQMKSIIFIPGTNECRRLRDFTKDERDRFNYLLNLSKIAIKYIQAQIIANSPLGRGGRVRVMSEHDFNDICQTLKEITTLSQETINNIVRAYIDTYFSRVKIPFKMKLFLIGCLDGNVRVESLSMDDIESEITVSSLEP